MRIGIITSSYPLSPADTVNAGVFVRDLALEIQKQGHQVFVLTPQKYGNIALNPELPVSFIPWWGGEKDLASTSMRNPFNLIRYATLVLSGLRKTIEFLRKNSIDTILAMWAIPNGLFALWGQYFTHVPYGVWALGSDIWSRNKYPFGNWTVRMVLQKASFRFADGIQLAKDVTDISGAPCEFVPSVRKLNPELQANSLELPESTRFLFIGRYEMNKGPDTLVEAMRIFLDEGGQAHLYLFGGGSLNKLLLERIKGYEDHIHLNGFADPPTVKLYMKNCNWLVIPSRIESIPLIFIDAIQMEIPVIATKVGDLKELIDEYQIGMSVPPQNPAELAQALHEACSQPRPTPDWRIPQKKFELAYSVNRYLENVKTILKPEKP